MTWANGTSGASNGARSNELVRIIEPRVDKKPEKEAL